MRSGNWRGLTFCLGLACALALGAHAQAQFHTIPRLVPAVDVNTGQPYYAPPIPYGHYAGKDLGGHICKKFAGLLHGHACSSCGGKGCGKCGNCGLSHHSGGSGGSGGLCDGSDGCGGGNGNGKGNGGLFHHNGGGLCNGADGCGLGGVMVNNASNAKACGLCGGKGGGCGHASTIAASSQGVPFDPGAGAGAGAGAGRCSDPGCGLFGSHKHKHGGPADPCSSCGGKGCGKCGKGDVCSGCGGKGCALCSKARGLLRHLLGHDKIDWFVGPGGPVPLTPGYTPYVVTTRSPRDFLSFPPFAP